MLELWPGHFFQGGDLLFDFGLGMVEDRFEIVHQRMKRCGLAKHSLAELSGLLGFSSIEIRGVIEQFAKRADSTYRASCIGFEDPLDLAMEVFSRRAYPLAVDLAHLLGQIDVLGMLVAVQPIRKDLAVDVACDG